MIKDTIFIKNNDAAYRIIDSNAVILTPEDSYLHTMNKTGTFIWELIDGKKKISDIALKVCEEFEVDKECAEKDARHFIEDLLRRRLISVKKK